MQQFLTFTCLYEAEEKINTLIKEGWKAVSHSCTMCDKRGYLICVLVERVSKPFIHPGPG